MKISILLIAIMLSGCVTTYAKVGIGYKIDQQEIIVKDNGRWDTKDTARFEIGIEPTDNITIGYTHRSQWSDDWPANNDKEYFVDEIFIDYKFELIK